MGAPAGFAFPVFGIHRRYLQRGEKKFASPDLGTAVSLVSFTREEAALPLEEIENDDSRNTHPGVGGRLWASGLLKKSGRS